MPLVIRRVPLHLSRGYTARPVVPPASNVISTGKEALRLVLTSVPFHVPANEAGIVVTGRLLDEFVLSGGDPSSLLSCGHSTSAMMAIPTLTPMTSDSARPRT